MADTLVRVPDVTVVSVFAAGPGGGNPAPIVADADGMSDEAMREVARTWTLESGFVLSSADSGYDFRFRFWVPNHEMEMCGHATVGAVWLLDRLGRLPSDLVRIATRSGPVRAYVRDDDALGRLVEVSQPAGHVHPISDASATDVLDVLGITAAELAARPIVNAATSRVKTLVPVRDVSVLDSLTPHYDRVAAVCGRVASTGLYPYAVTDDQTLDARQFPRSSGYPEDAATGIAAAALAFSALQAGLVDASEPVRVRQGRAMGRPSEMVIRFDDSGCWLSGPVHLER